MTLLAVRTTLSRKITRRCCTTKKNATRLGTGAVKAYYSSSASPPATSTELDTICELASSNLRFGPGSTAEIGQDLEFMKAKNVIIMTDRNVERLPPMKVLLESLERHNIKYDIYNDVRVEPNDVSFRHAINYFEKYKQDRSNFSNRYESSSAYDAVIAIGGGSVIDTAKCANLYCTYPPEGGDFYDYVNPPLGKGLPVPSGDDMPPLIAIPTTAGTGSETTGVAIFDDTPTRSKTGIAHRKLKPTLGIVDPNNTRTMPATVATFSGLDVLCHAIESYTALPFNKRPKPVSSVHRPAYQGSNPISDIWSLFALQTTAKYLRRAVNTCHDPDNHDDEEARTKMIIASSAAGLGFGNAGVHLCHGLSYAIASQVKKQLLDVGVDSKSQSQSQSSIYTPDGYNINETGHYLVPHGLSVIVNAPSVFEFTGVSDRDRHGTCARILKQARMNDDATYFPKPSPDTGRWLADEIRHLMYDLDVPMGLKPFGYNIDDIDALVEGTLPQHRVTKLSPRPVTRKDLEDLFLSVYNES